MEGQPSCSSHTYIQTPALEDQNSDVPHRGEGSACGPCLGGSAQLPPKMSVPGGQETLLSCLQDLHPEFDLEDATCEYSRYGGALWVGFPDGHADQVPGESWLDVEVDLDSWVPLAVHSSSCTVAVALRCWVGGWVEG